MKEYIFASNFVCFLVFYPTQVTVPGWEFGAPTVENVDAFLQYALGLIQSSPREHDKLLHNIRSVVGNIEETLRDL